MKTERDDARNWAYRITERGTTWKRLDSIVHNKKVLSPKTSQVSRLRHGQKTMAEIRGDMAKFVFDRVFQEGFLKDRFGWEDISLRQMSALFSAFSGSPRQIVHGQIKESLANYYPSYYEMLDGARCPEARYHIPPGFFYKCFYSQFKDHQDGEEAEKAIHLASTKFGLCPAEYAVLLCLSRGVSKKEIAHFMGVKTNTIKDQTNAIWGKLTSGEKNTSYHLVLKIIRVAFEEGLIPASFRWR